MKAQTPIDIALLRRRLAPWQARWERQAKRIDALSLRERAILFLSIAAVLAAIFDTAVLSPLSARAKQRRDEQVQQATELAQLREQFITASRGSSGDPAMQLQAQLVAAKEERQRLDAELQTASTINSGEGLSAVLQRLLAQQPGLALEKLALLDDTPVAAPKITLAALVTGVPASAPGPAPVRPAAPTMPGMTWQGVELQVHGSYRDMLRYVQGLERELPGLRWGELHLTTTQPGELPRLSAQVFLLKVQP